MFFRFSTRELLQSIDMLVLGGGTYDPTRHICAVYDNAFFEIDVCKGSVLSVFIPKNFK